MQVGEIEAFGESKRVKGLRNVFMAATRSRRAGLWWCAAVPLLFGLISLALGQDSNWDLFNYHLYNPFAFLNGKLGTDLAPAGFQSYFNPLLDLPYYLMVTHWPAQVAGFVMGFLHGLNFILLYFIAREVLDAAPEPEAARRAILIALCGCLSASFLSELGNSMGDDTTALFVLGGLLVLLRGWGREGEPMGAASLLGGGLLVGLGTGLKLTNGIYAVAFCGGLLFVPGLRVASLRAATLFGAGVLAGMTLTAGFWFAKMWQMFGDPLFPQFSSIFPSPLVRNIGIADHSWKPGSWLEVLVWPYLFALDAKRVGQIRLHELLWPLLYTLFFWWGARRLLSSRRAQALQLGARPRYLLACIALAYLVWLAVFGVFRYLIPAGLLAPLAIYVLCVHLFGVARGRRVAGWGLGICVAVVLLGGVNTWGHDGWADPALRADLPVVARPQRTTVLLVGSDPASAWLAVLFPPKIAFASVEGSFPAGPAYSARLHQMVSRRGGPTFAIIPAVADPGLAMIARTDALLTRLGLTRTERGCGFLEWLVARFHPKVRIAAAKAPDRQCSVEPLPANRVDLVAGDRMAAARGRKMLARAGFRLMTGSCMRETAYLGASAHFYQWCAVRPEGASNASRSVHYDAGARSR